MQQKHERWGTYVPHLSKKMKSSNYNIFIEDRGCLLLYNLLSGAFVKIKPNNTEIIKNILENPNKNPSYKELYDQLIYGKFIIEDELNELRILKLRNMAGRFNSTTFGLTIAPTLDCNFSCIYCYEKTKKIYMSEKTEDDLIEFVKKALKDKKLFGVTWYGGEPLLMPDTIFRLSKKFIDICAKKNIKYSSGIITNGFLLNNNIIKKLKKHRIISIQITIDGPRDIHNKRRKLRNGGPTFDIILNNLKTLVNKTKVRVSLRINIDKDNYKRAPELLKLLEEKGLLKKLSISLSPVLGYTESCIGYVDRCFTRMEYAKLEIEFFKSALSKNIPIQQNMPRQKLGYCSADSWASYSVDPEGFLYKCWTDIGEKEWSVGNIKDDKVTFRLFDYLGWDPFESEECLKCKFLPICMGGCPRIRLAGKKPPEMCTSWKYNLIEMLKLFYFIRQKEITQ